jgi:hypothetical protein
MSNFKDQILINAKGKFYILLSYIWIFLTFELWNLGFGP